MGDGRRRRSAPNRWWKNTPLLDEDAWKLKIISCGLSSSQKTWQIIDLMVT